MVNHNKFVGFFIVIAVLALFSICASAAEKGDLAQIHKKADVKCGQCHGSKIPEKSAKKNKHLNLATKENCLKCHGSYAELGEKTKGIAPWEENPHKNHFGELECFVCHKVHEPSVYFCQTCHIELKTPAGWTKAKISGVE